MSEGSGDRTRGDAGQGGGVGSGSATGGRLVGEVMVACEDATVAFGRGLASVLRAGDVVRLTGGLGAGKTTLVRAVASALGVRAGLVSSPTFVLINVYEFGPGENWPGGGRLVHADAYRADGAETLANAGWDRLFDERGVPRGALAAVVEWPERIGAALPAESASVALEPVGPEARLARVELPESWRARPGAEYLTWREPTRCRVTGGWVAPTNPSYPFADAKARLADLGKWFGGTYTISRPAREEE